eukprot:2132107-Alexandrium_andersonii.AAC.1
MSWQRRNSRAKAAILLPLFWGSACLRAEGPCVKRNGPTAWLPRSSIPLLQRVVCGDLCGPPRTFGAAV